METLHARLCKYSWNCSAMYRNTVCEHYKFIEQVLIIKYQLGEPQPNELDVPLKLNVIVVCLCDVPISLTTCWCSLSLNLGLIRR